MTFGEGIHPLQKRIHPEARGTPIADYVWVRRLTAEEVEAERKAKEEKRPAEILEFGRKRR